MIPKGKLEDVIKEWLIIQWAKDTKGEIRSVIKEWLILQWSKDTKGEIRRRNQRMTDNKMSKWYQRGN
jgi:hypothetical protein